MRGKIESCFSGAGNYTRECGTSRFVRAVLPRCEDSKALLSAVVAGDVGAVSVLLRSGMDTTEALHGALLARVGVDVIQLLADQSRNLNAWLPEPAVILWVRCACRVCGRRCGATSSCVSRKGGQKEHLDALLAAGADVNAVGPSAETGLHIVAWHLRAVAPDSSEERLAHLRSIWHSLVSRGADASIPDGDGRSSMEMLSSSQCRELLAAKRGQYSTRRYDAARFHGGDPSLAWSDSARLQRGSSSPRSFRCPRGCTRTYSSSFSSVSTALPSAIGGTTSATFTPPARGLRC